MTTMMSIPLLLILENAQSKPVRGGSVSESSRQCINLAPERGWKSVSQGIEEEMKEKRLTLYTVSRKYDCSKNLLSDWYVGTCIDVSANRMHQGGRRHH
jgi:hypothetical protein